MDEVILMNHQVINYAVEVKVLLLALKIDNGFGSAKEVEVNILFLVKLLLLRLPLKEMDSVDQQMDEVIWINRQKVIYVA